MTTPSKDAASNPPSTPVAVVQSKGRLLIVEDHAINQQVARGIAAKLGYDCDVAAGGREALTALERRSYDAVLMSCHMPEMDGFEVTAEIRRREAGERRVPIIAMTAGTMAEDRDRCIAAGMDDYVSKPVTESDLEAALDRWVLAGAPALHQEDRGGRPADDVLDAAQVEGLRQLAALSEEPDFLRGLVDLYLDQAGVHMEALRSAAASGDAPGLVAAAHSLKGTSATMGAKGVAAACEVLEISAARGVIAHTEVLDRLAEQLERTAQALRLEASRT